jgi:hypothetical protein
MAKSGDLGIESMTDLIGLKEPFSRLGFKIYSRRDVFYL